MPRYQVTLDGKTFIVEGDRPPTEDEARTAFAAYTPPKDSTPAAQPEARSVRGFLGNLASSAGNFVKDTVTGIPTMAKAAGHLAVAGINPAYKDMLVGQLAPQLPGALKAAGEGLKNRYGGMEQIKNTLYTDPVGVLSDASMVLDPAMVATKAGGFAKAANVLGKASEATNPLRLAGRMIEPVTHAGANAVVRGTLRAPAAVRGDFGGSKKIADAVLKDRVFSEASAGRKLDTSVSQADKMLAEAEAAGVAGVPRRDVARSVLGEPKEIATLDTKLGEAPNTSLMDTAKGITRNNPREIPLTEAQTMKRRAQARAYEAGVDNQTVKKAAETAKAKSLRAGIEARVPGVGPVNERSQRLLGSKLAFGAAEDRPRNMNTMLSILGGGAGFAGAGPAGAVLLPALMKAADSPRAGALAGIALNEAGKLPNTRAANRAALLARLFGTQEEE